MTATDDGYAIAIVITYLFGVPLSLTFISGVQSNNYALVCHIAPIAFIIMAFCWLIVGIGAWIDR